MLYDRPYMRQPQYGESNKTSMVTTLLVITIGVFVLQQVVNVFFPGPRGGENPFLANWFGLNWASFQELKVWTIFSYGLLHSTAGFMHILGNMLGLFFIGRMLEPVIGAKRFLWLYVGGTFLGGVAYLLLHYSDGPLFVYNGAGVYPTLVGASASVTAILSLYCLLNPERPITLLLFFVLPVTMKPKWIFWGSLALSVGGLLFYELPGKSNVGHSAHLGGLLAGVLYFRYVHDRAPSFFEASSSGEKISVELPDWFKRKQKVKKEFTYKVNRSSRDELQKEVDRILDKINESDSGFGSLTDDEKKTLEHAKDILSR